MNLEVVEELVKMMEKSTLSSMEVECEGMKVKLGKNSTAANVETIKEVRQSNTIEKSLYEEEKAQDKNTYEQNQAAEGIDYIKAPMVGTFYSAPSPDKKAFVKPGDKIEKGKVLCIIEAMKLMNEIEAEEEGTIVDVLIHDGDMVEYGQPIFRIKK